jgi:hypothetical protein
LSGKRVGSHRDEGREREIREREGFDGREFEVEKKQGDKKSLDGERSEMKKA